MRKTAIAFLLVMIAGCSSATGPLQDPGTAGLPPLPLAGGAVRQDVIRTGLTKKYSTILFRTRNRSPADSRLRRLKAASPSRNVISGSIEQQCVLRSQRVAGNRS